MPLGCPIVRSEVRRFADVAMDDMNRQTCMAYGTDGIRWYYKYRGMTYV